MDEALKNAAEPSKQHQQLHAMRLSAAKAFYEANYSQTLRKALLSQSRARIQQYCAGDWVYYWRESDSKLDISRRRGPAIIRSVQPRAASNARVIIQGFRHVDVVRENLVRESPTLSRLGRMMVMVWAVHRGWKLWCADIKSAFMQADSIDDKTRIYVKPTSDMRRKIDGVEVL